MTGGCEDAEGKDGESLQGFTLMDQIEKARGMDMMKLKLACDKNRLLNNGQLRAEVPYAADLAAENSTLREEKEALKREVDELRRQRAENEAIVGPAELEEQSERRRQQDSTTQASSEGRLRSALTRRDTTTTELRQAIRAVEALVDEARRELGARELRERRAAYEALHAAMTGDDEDTLELAINRALLAEVDLEDVQRGEAKLTELRSLTPEQRAAKLARDLESKRKKEAFSLLKKDDPEALNELLSSLDASVRWQDWKDYAGRSLLRCCTDMRATRVKQYLTERLGLQQASVSSPSERRNSKPAPSVNDIQSLIRKASREEVEIGTTASEEQRPTRSLLQSLNSPLTVTTAKEEEQAVSSEPRPDAAVEQRQQGSPELPVDRSDTAMSEGCTSQCASSCASPSRIHLVNGAEGENAELRQRALRAVAQDDTAALEEVLNRVDRDVWSKWTNKAGKDLLTLSQERGSSLAYSMLARHLGMLKELQREAFEERESVWVFVGNEVQPRRATVLEDTPLEAQEVSVEFWDGDEPPVMVEKCMIRKMWG